MATIDKAVSKAGSADSQKAEGNGWSVLEGPNFLTSKEPGGRGAALESKAPQGATKIS